MRADFVGSIMTAFACAASASSIYNGFEQSGSCHTDHQMEVASCDDVWRYCSSANCNDINDVYDYSCSWPYVCTGKAAPATPAPTAWQPGFDDCINGRKLQLTTCGSTTGFDDMGCTCYTCTEVNGYIRLQCTAPYQCSNSFWGPSASTQMPSPELDTTDYAIIIGVFGGVSGIIGLFAFFTNKEKGAKKSYFQMAVDMVKSSLSGMFVEPNFRDDGTKTTLLEFWASQNVWIALMSRCCWCCKRPSSSVAPHYRQPKSLARCISEIVANASIVLSLALLLGTVVNNTETCSTTIDGSYCRNGNSVIIRSGETSLGGVNCEAIDSSMTLQAKVLTVVLSMVIGWSCDYAEGTAGGDKKRKRTMMAVRIVATIGLLAFGFVYSFAITREASDGDKDAAVRRTKTITSVFGVSWLADEISGTVNLFLQRVGVCFAPCIKRTKRGDVDTQKTTATSGPVVHPVVPSAPLDASGVNLQMNTPHIDKLVVATDDAMVKD